MREPTYTLLLRDSQERVINGTTTTCNLTKTKLMGWSLLEQLEHKGVAFVDVYNFVSKAAIVADQKPLSRICMDGES